MVSGTDGHPSFTKSCRVVFLKSCGLLKGRIQSGVVAGQKKSGDVMVTLLRKRVPVTVSTEVSTSNIAKHIENVWELQRRTTIFQTDWRAPFLPHDRCKRWRWVDDSYDKHCWIEDLPRESAAASSEPPLSAQPDLKALGEWKVNMSHHATDPEGWQHAIDFYRGDWYWHIGHVGYSVRRRMWTCSFAQSADVDRCSTPTRSRGLSTPRAVLSRPPLCSPKSTLSPDGGNSLTPRRR